MLSENKENSGLKEVFAFIAKSIRSKREASIIRSLALNGTHSANSDMEKKVATLKEERKIKEQRLKDLKGQIEARKRALQVQKG